MFAHPDHERLVQQAAVIQIANQARKSRVECRQQAILQPREMFPVRVPVSIKKPKLVPKNRQKLSAGFDEPPCSQARLAEEGQPVILAHAHRLLSHVQGVGQGARGNRRIGHLPITIERLGGRARIELRATHVVQLRQ